MPGGTDRSRPFLHCSSFKMIIRKTAWKSSLTLFINIPLADGDGTAMRNMHGQTLHHPLPFKDTESESAVAPLEVMTDSGFYYSERISKNFFFLMCHHLLLFVGGIVISGVTRRFGFLFFFPHIAAHKLAFLLLLWNLLQIPLSRSQIEWAVNASVYLRRLEMKWWSKILKHDRGLTPSDGRRAM